MNRYNTSIKAQSVILKKTDSIKSFDVKALLASQEQYIKQLNTYMDKLDEYRINQKIHNDKNRSP